MSCNMQLLSLCFLTFTTQVLAQQCQAGSQKAAYCGFDQPNSGSNQKACFSGINTGAAAKPGGSSCVVPAPTNDYCRLSVDQKTNVWTWSRPYSSSTPCCNCWQQKHSPASSTAAPTTSKQTSSMTTTPATVTKVINCTCKKDYWFCSDDSKGQCSAGQWCASSTFNKGTAPCAGKAGLLQDGLIENEEGSMLQVHSRASQAGAVQCQAGSGDASFCGFDRPSRSGPNEKLCWSGINTGANATGQCISPSADNACWLDIDYSGSYAYKWSAKGLNCCNCWQRKDWTPSLLQRTTLDSESDATSAIQLSSWFQDAKEF